jgi:hypothetical protein
VARVLYAIENGGFSGQIMPQNIVVGPDAEKVARFVATYAGRQAPSVPGAIVCDKEPIGTLPASSGATTSTGTSSVTTAAVSTAISTPTSTTPKKTKGGPAHKRRGGAAHRRSRRKRHRP